MRRTKEAIFTAKPLFISLPACRSLLPSRVSTLEAAKLVNGSLQSLAKKSRAPRILPKNTSFTKHYPPSSARCILREEQPAYQLIILRRRDGASLPSEPTEESPTFRQKALEPPGRGNSIAEDKVACGLQNPEQRSAVGLRVLGARAARSRGG